MTARPWSGWSIGCRHGHAGRREGRPSATRGGFIVVDGLEPGTRVVTAGVHSLEPTARRCGSRRGRRCDEALQPLRMGARAPLAGLVLHARLRRRRRRSPISSLGREEDPSFTIKTMMIQAQWPGASIEDTHQPGHRAHREEARGAREPRLHPQHDHAGPDHGVRQPEGSTDPAATCPPTWVQVRNMINDIRGQFPEGVVGPVLQRPLRRRLRQHLRLHRRRTDPAPAARLCRGRRAPRC